MKLNVVAIDDEPLALKLVSDYIRKTPFLELLGSFENPMEALEFLNNHKADLIFLDIQMPGLLGTEFARMVDAETRIIFTTAYSQYAVEGFKLEAVDYLLKPFGYEEFLESAGRAKKRIHTESAPSVTVETKDNFLFLKSEYKIRRINFDDILYVEGLKDYIKVYLKGEDKPVLSLSSLKVMEEKLPSLNFMRVHRSYIVNLSQVNQVDRSRIVFGKVYIPVSDQYKEKFQEFLDRNFL